MSELDLGRPIKVPEEKKAEFKSLSEVPEYSRPTIIMAAVLFFLVLAIDIWAVFFNGSLWVAVPLLVFTYYWYFSVIHDGVHRSIAKNKTINDRVCQMAISLYAPYASIGVFRWAHMEHHRFTNEEDKDPDIWCHGTFWSMPLRWMTIDFYYGYRALVDDRPAVKKVVKESLPNIVIGLALIALIIAAGYGWEYLMLWFLPTRLAFVAIGFSFFWLPHAHWPDPKEELRQSKNFTVATAVRVGKEWLLNPLLQYQNYHLIHHLWPTTPFYNNQKLWQLVEPELRERDLALAEGFNLQPTIMRAGASA